MAALYFEMLCFVLQNVFDEVLIEETGTVESGLEFIRGGTPHAEIQHQQIDTAEVTHVYCT